MGITLIGLPGAGKTTTGRLLAGRLGVGFTDTDALIEARAGRSISEIFANAGEAGFRALEEAAVMAALAAGGVVSLGGGAVLNPVVRRHLAGHDVVWLDVPVERLADRIGTDQARPLLAGDVVAALRHLAEARRGIYEAVATIRVDASAEPESVVAAVVEALGGPAPTVVRVATASPYDVVIGRGVAGRAAALLDGANRTAVLYPAVLAGLAARLAAGMPGPVLIEVPDGEAAKTPAVLADCWSRLAGAGLTRSDMVVGLGGGSVTDLAGFVAASYLRGIGYVNIPTTVLGMADAAVGGKTGINLPEGKNLAGAFWEPRGVFSDLALLDSLPAPEVRSGLAEIVKCGFIADPVILDTVATAPERVQDIHSAEFRDVLTRAVCVKAAVVEADLREQGAAGGIGRESLNYGHTLGHAIEKLEGFTWAHGDADAVGMVFAAEVARRLGRIGDAEVARHRAILSGLGLPVRYSGADWADVRATMSLDKKARGSHLRMVLLEAGGAVGIVADPDEAVLARAFEAIG